MGRLGWVYFQNRLAGTLQETDEDYIFSYDSSYLKTGVAIAYTLPISEFPYHSSTLHPFFENLLSEGWLLMIQTQFEHLDPMDKFGLLITHGSDLCGAVRVEASDVL